MNKLEHLTQLDSYQDEVEFSANTKLDEQSALVEALFGLAGETGEFIDIVKKQMFHGRSFNEFIAKKELGDVLWYVARIAKLLGFKLSDVAKCNIEKLRIRYPNGYTTNDAILHRG